MKNLEHILQELKKIEPERDYSNRSLSMIVMGPRNSKRSWLSFTFLHVAEYGAAVALVGLFLFMMLGNSSLVQLFSPIQSNSLNSGGLRAEAEAIDIQIKLLDVNYTENAKTTTSTILKITVPKKKLNPTNTVVSSSSLLIASSTEETPSTTPATVEDVLDLLSL